MINLKLVLVAMSVIASTVSYPENKGWHGIVPLHSSRRDVQRLLGKHTKNDETKYHSKDENALIYYSSGPCGKDPTGSWNVPRDTVIAISVYPKIKPKFSDLRVDEARYKREEDPEVTSITYYTDEQKGVRLTVGGGIVAEIDYIPAASDNHLRCPVPGVGVLWGDWGHASEREGNCRYPILINCTCSASSKLKQASGRSRFGLLTFLSITPHLFLLS